MKRVKIILCWFGRHDWDFKGGRWVIPKQAAITRRHCRSCELYQEICQNHVHHLRFLDLSERRPFKEGLYDDLQKA